MALSPDHDKTAGPPTGEAEQPGSSPGESLSFLQPGAQPGSLGRLGYFEVLELLGKGGFGIVLKALDDKLQRLVAIKVLDPHLARNPTARSRFIREARASAAVNHKHVVSTYQVNEQPIPYLVMEYVAGKTLQDRIDQTGSLATRDILRIGGEIAEGLAAAHQRGLIHRDIKPANILLENGRVKIADFGLARAADDASLTQSGVITGTPLFMSPEQAQGETLDHRSDLFSLGSVLYTMCTGHPPFRAHKTLGVLKRVCDDTPRPIRDSNPEIPDALAASVNMLMAKDPAGRFQTAAAVADLFKQHLAHLDDPPLELPSSALAGAETAAYFPSAAKKRARSRRKWAAAAAAVVLLPVLALAVTEFAGITHWFRGGGAPIEPNKSGGEPTAPPAYAETPPLAVAAAAEANPLKNAKVGDWAEFKETQAVNGRNLDMMTQMEVTAKTEKTAIIRMIVTVNGRAMTSGDQKIDLSKPYDPAPTPKRGLVADAKNAEGESGTEKLKVGDKEYQTSWATKKFTGKINGQNLEFNYKYWTSRSAPLGGLVRMETTSVQQVQANRIELKTTRELRRSGSNGSLMEASRYLADAQNKAAHADWSAAAAAYARYFAVQPLDKGEIGFEYAAVLLLSGDQPRFQQICDEMLQRGGQPGVRPYHVARAWTLAFMPGTDAALVGQRAANELKQNSKAFWSLTEQGALAYRAGRYDEAATLLDQSLKADGRPGRAVVFWLWLALVEDRRGKPAEAAAWLEKGTKWFEQHPSFSGVEDDATGMHLHNWLEAQVLHREAARTLRLPAVLRGEDKPKDKAERLAFAQIAYDHKQFAGAARLWAEALDSDPKQADDLEAAHLYNAACAAALAAAGQREDAAKLEDTERARLRKQALHWLRADLVLRTKQLESGKRADYALGQWALQHWQKDSDLAGIRDGDALSKLPPDERAAFTQLWADVAELLKKAAEKPK